MELSILYRVGWTLVHSLSEVTAIAIIARLGLTIVPRRRADIRYLCALIGLVAIILDLVMTFSSIPNGAAAALGVSHSATLGSIGREKFSTQLMVSTDLNGRAIDKMPRPFRTRIAAWLDSNSSNIAGVWVVGVSLLCLWRVAEWFSVQRLRVLRTVSAGVAINDLARKLADLIGVTLRFEVLISHLVETPLLIGWLRPMILLPASVITGLSTIQLQAILLHELAHIRRHDYLVNLLQTAVETLLFYHPAVWWLSRHIRLEREQACDDIAVHFCNDRRVYAKSLAALEEVRLLQTLAMPASGSGGRQTLLRVQRILKSGDEMSNRNNLMAILLLGICIAGGLVYGVWRSGSSHSAFAPQSPSTMLLQAISTPQVSDDSQPYYGDKARLIRAFDADRKRLADLKNRYEIEYRMANEEIDALTKQLSAMGIDNAGMGSNAKPSELNHWVQEKINLETQKEALDVETSQLTDAKTKHVIPPPILESVERYEDVMSKRAELAFLRRTFDDAIKTATRPSPGLDQLQEKLRLSEAAVRDAQSRACEPEMTKYESNLVWRQNTLTQRLALVESHIAPLKSEISNIITLQNKLAKIREDELIYRESVKKYDAMLTDFDSKIRTEAIQVRMQSEDRAAATDSVFRFNIPFSTGKTEFVGDDWISIGSVKGTRPDMQAGMYCITGKYNLASKDRAVIAAFVTMENEIERASPLNPAQKLEIKKGSGTFTLRLPVNAKGFPHVSFYDDKSSFGGIYLGTGDGVLEK